MYIDDQYATVFFGLASPLWVCGPANQALQIGAQEKGFARQNAVTSITPFVWRPGSGVDAQASARLRAHCGKPRKPMGEAWLMGDDRSMFCELEGELSLLSVDDLQSALREISSGLSCFGHLPEWEQWYHYLLGQLLPRAHESTGSSLLESLVTGFIALYPDGVQAPPYEQFLEDALRTLGQCLMDEPCWSGSNIVVGAFLHRSESSPAEIGGWWDASGDFSASMFFCLKYLPATSIRAWLQSALAIPALHWRAQVLVWFVGAHEVLIGRVKWPSEFSVKARPSIGWHGSDYLRPELLAMDGNGAPVDTGVLPEPARRMALHTITAHFTDKVFVAWLESLSSVPSLEAELAEIPARFEDLYLRVDSHAIR